MTDKNLTATGGGYAPEGWLQWPDDSDFSFQFVRILAAAQEGASTIGECFQTAGRIAAGDRESWHAEWMKTGHASRARAEEAEEKGYAETAKANWIRATNYYRSAEFFLDPQDDRRLPNFDLIELCSHRAMALMEPKGEIVKIPYTDEEDPDAYMDGYFLPTPVGSGARPAVVAFGGLDEFKDELIQEMTKYAHPRGFSVLYVDLPGQGGTLRRRGKIARPDTEVPVSGCVDYLLSRADVDPDRIALYGASLGGYYSARAASFEKRFKCAVVDGAQWCLADSAKSVPADSPGVALMLAKWVFGAETHAELVEIAQEFDLNGVVDKISYPLLIVHGEEDEWGRYPAETLYEYTKKHGVDVEIKWFAANETGAAHCQCDNPTLGMEYICDWIGAQLGCLDEK